MTLELTEAQLTMIIKEAMAHYKDKPFGKAIFVQKENGIMVQFCDEGVDTGSSESERPRHREDPDPYAPAKQMLTTWAAMGLMGGNTTGGGFGGGRSGGGGASGGW